MKKIPVWKNVVLLVSIVVVIVIATFAWFFNKSRGSVEDMTMRVGKATYIQVSGNKGENWSDDLEIDIGINKTFKEISGNGSLFYGPVYDNIQLDDGSFTTKIVEFNQVNSGEKYYEQTIDFRADSIETLYLAPESYVTAVNDQGESNINGAIRVAFFEMDTMGNEHLRCIWAPNSKVEYSYEENAFTSEGNVEPYYYYQKTSMLVDPNLLPDGASENDVAIISTENTDEDGCGYDATHKFMWSNGENLPDDAPALVTLNRAGDEDLYYKSLKIRVWIEGYDRECVSLLSGQGFAMKLEFYAQKGE